MSKAKEKDPKKLSPKVKEIVEQVEISMKRRRRRVVFTDADRRILGLPLR